MSDEMAAHKRGRRNIRRLTRRKIALPTSGTTSERPEADPAVDFAAAAVEARNPVGGDSGGRNAEGGLAAEGGGVASSLSELRLPDDGSAASSETLGTAAGSGEVIAAGGGVPSEAAAERGSRAAGADDKAATSISAASLDLPPAAAEHGEDEPTTNPQIRLAESLRAAAGRDSNGSDAVTSRRRDRAESGKRGSNQPPPAAGASSLPPPAPTTDNSAEVAIGATAEPASESSRDDDAAATSGVGDAESEPITGQHPNVSAPGPGATSAVLRKPDSDAPTRPRIELSADMALAAGRVTSLELSPIRPEQPPRRGSKMPPPGEPRVVSSLTGRRSQFPPSSDEEEAAVRPAVVVTRSKFISDRPPKMQEAESMKPARADAGKRHVHEAAKRATTATDKLGVADGGKPEAAESDALESRPFDSFAPSIETEIPEPETAEIAKPRAVELAPPVSSRPSRRPSGAEGDEFETLDIEDGEVESQSLRGETEIDAVFDDDEPTKAPPPPPQLKRAGVPPAPVAVAAGPSKAAPPPPPRVTGQLPVAAASASPLAPMLGPSAPGSAASAAAVASGSPMISPASFGSGAAPAAPSKRGSRPQQRRRQWWETLFSDDYLRTVVRPTAVQIARQVDFMQASLGVAKGTAVLDVGCGLGQHALEFARRGCLVVALDLALPMITRAAEDAQQEGLHINFLHKDIRDIGFEGTFDAVICVGTTFGFFDDEQNREVLGRLANALKPGGRLLLEVVNRDHVLDSQPNLQWFEGDGCVVMEESDFNYYSSRLTVKRTMMREDGRQTESEYSIRLYALHELGQMMQAVGFRVKEVSGGQATRGVFFGAQSSRIILLAERRTPSPARSNGHGTSDAPPPAES